MAKVARKEISARSGGHDALTRRLAANRFIIWGLSESHCALITRRAQNVASILRINVAWVIRAGARNEALSFGHVNEAISTGGPLSCARVRRRRQSVLAEGVNLNYGPVRTGRRSVHLSHYCCRFYNSNRRKQRVRMLHGKKGTLQKKKKGRGVVYDLPRGFLVRERKENFLASCPMEKFLY